MYGFIIAFIIAIIAFFSNIVSSTEVRTNKPLYKSGVSGSGGGSGVNNNGNVNSNRSNTTGSLTNTRRKKEIVMDFIRQNKSKYIIIVGDININTDEFDQSKIIYVDHNSGIKLENRTLDIDNLSRVTKIKSQMTVELAEQLQLLDCVLVYVTNAKTDSARLLQLARQYAIFEMVKPKKAILSLCLPQYNQKRAEFIEQVNRESYKYDFEYVKDIGIDFITDYYNKSIVFYDGLIAKSRRSFIITDGTRTKLYVQ